jgi:transketolase
MDAAPADLRATQELDLLAINTLRFLAVDAIEKAGSGHPGLPLGAAPMAYVLWTKFLRHNPANPLWFDRDRFILSAGHGSMLLYGLLHLTGYALPLEQLKAFRQWGSLTPGHPERGRTPGVEATTGPLGQGFGMGVGMAMAEAHLAARYNRPGYKVIDHYTYGLVSDGDLMEGVAAESASLAGHLKLGKLIYLYDDNRITLSASTQVAFTEDHARRFEACGWHTSKVEDGNDLEAIEGAIHEARRQTDRPSLILVRTHLGYGSPKQDTFAAHGAPLGAEATRLTKQRLGWPEEPGFLIPEAASDLFRRALDQGLAAETVWQKSLEGYQDQDAELASELLGRIKGERPDGWNNALPVHPADAVGMATRDASAHLLNAVRGLLPSLMGGAADLSPSTRTELVDEGNFENPDRATGDLQGSAGGGWSYQGRNVAFGVREHGMGALMNGLAAHGGFIPFGATFLTFSDYLRPAIRLAALMGLQVVYVFTHDSIAMGEDGPTHQPVEQLASLRTVPGLIVIRPGDANETTVAWQVALETRDHPVALVLSRQNLPTLDREVFAPAEGLRQGAYILADPPGAANVEPLLILIASGSEVALIVEAGRILQQRGIPVRLVSMPSWELFEAQPQAYRDTVLPHNLTLRLAVEAGVAQGWERYTGDPGGVLSVETFGASAPGPVVLREFGFTPDQVCERALYLLGREHA